MAKTKEEIELEETETADKKDAEFKKLENESGMGDATISTKSITSGFTSVTGSSLEDLSTGATAMYDESKDPKLVKVTISYPKDHDREKFFKDGSHQYVSPETADHLIDNGIAKKAN